MDFANADQRVYMLKLTVSKEQTAVCHPDRVGWEMAQTQRSLKKKKKRNREKRQKRERGKCLSSSMFEIMKRTDVQSD